MQASLRAWVMLQVALLACTVPVVLGDGEQLLLWDDQGEPQVGPVRHDKIGHDILNQFEEEDAAAEEESGGLQATTAEGQRSSTQVLKPDGLMQMAQQIHQQALGDVDSKTVSSATQQEVAAGHIDLNRTPQHGQRPHTQLSMGLALRGPLETELFSTSTLQGKKPPQEVSQGPMSATQVKAMVVAAVKSAVKGRISVAVHRAVEDTILYEKDEGSTPAQMHASASKAAAVAAKAASRKVDQALVEAATKSKAIEVAKAEGKRVARAAAAAGRPAAQQAAAARAAASRIAISFAETAHKIGLRAAHAEAAQLRAAPQALILGQVGILAHLGKISPKIAAKIRAAAKAGVHSGVSSARAIANKEIAQARGRLSSQQKAKIKALAPLAVKRAANALPGPGISAQPHTATHLGTDLARAPRLSLSKAADHAKEREKKKELSKYKRLAAAEKEQVRRALRVAAQKQAAAAKFVGRVARNSLARGLGTTLSTRNLKMAAKRATASSKAVERAVKGAVNKAIQEKQRLKHANEKVAKAGSSATREAHRKNIRHRRAAARLAQVRKTQAKSKAVEVKRKKQEANEAAHKAIAKVVRVTGKKASRAAARVNAAAIQKTYLADACHRRTQHRLRVLAARAKHRMARRGMSKVAQQRAMVATLKAHQAGVVQRIVSGSVRRNAHVAATAAHRAAMARGLSTRMQLQASRRAWKATSPKIRSFCLPAAQSAARYELANPGHAPRKINRQAFIVKAVRTMQTAVRRACAKATKPIVLDGAKKAALHAADYHWQVKMGMQEAARVCKAAVALYAHNADIQSKQMVARTFRHAAKKKSTNARFHSKLRAAARSQVTAAAERAAKAAAAQLRKKCKAKIAAATKFARAKAKRAAVRHIVIKEARKAAKAAAAKAYRRAIEDGLSVARAKQLGTKAFTRTKARVLVAATSALRGLAPARTTTHALQLLRTEWHSAKRRSTVAHREVAKLRKTYNNTDAAKAATAKAIRAAEDAAMDEQRLRHQVQDMQLQVDARGTARHENHAVAQITQVLSKFKSAAKDAKTQAERRRALIGALTRGIKELHSLGGHLPSEARAHTLQLQLTKAQAQIAHLQSRVH